MATRLDQARLKKGQRASTLLEPKTKEETKMQLAQLDDAVTAMQSLDDLGTLEANREAMALHDKLMERYLRLKKECEELTD